jgi:hypothetical protein
LCFDEEGSFRGGGRAFGDDGKKEQKERQAEEKKTEKENSQRERRKNRTSPGDHHRRLPGAPPFFGRLDERLSRALEESLVVHWLCMGRVWFFWGFGCGVRETFEMREKEKGTGKKKLLSFFHLGTASAEVACLLPPLPFSGRS